MSKKLIINKTFNESRAVLLENDEILDYLLDRGHENFNEDHPNVGNIYLGKVLRVLPGMQSAFIDIGYEKAAFLYVDDAYIPSLEEQREMAERSRKTKAEELKNRVGEVIPDEFSTLSEQVDMRFRPEGITIESFLNEGDEIIVQVAKEPISTKGPRVTRHVTLAGRYVVFMPFIEHTGVSRRIEDDGERDRLKDVLDNMRPDGKGVIARTVAEGQSGKTLKADYNMLSKIWKEVDTLPPGIKAPSMIHKDLNFVQRVLRDITDEDVSDIIVDDKLYLKEVDRFIAKFLPGLKGKCKLYNDDLPIFEKFGIDMEIARGLSNKVFLRSGGSLNIDQTEAMVTVDVNTGKFVGRKNLEETILRTNLEAVKEIAYQLRLRNCGGIIILDFIDMEKEENKKMVYDTLMEALKKDRAKTNVLPISGLGLIEMTRKRTRDTLVRTMCEPCPYCEGVGRVKSTMTVCYELVRELTKTLKNSDGPKVFIYAHPQVTARLCGEDLDFIESIEEQFGKTLNIRSDNNFHIEQFEIFTQEY